MSEKFNAPAIRCKGVRFRYPWQKEDALAGIDLEVMPDTICGLLGRNAAGKTTLMSLLAGLRRHTVGEIEILGEPPYENPNIASRVAFVHANDNDLYLGMKVREVLKTTALFRENWDDELARLLLHAFHVPEKKSVGSLSMGQRAALSCAIGIASRAPLTIFDEAYSGMDAVYRKILAEALLNDFMEHPRTILFSTHYISEWDKLFSEVAIIDEGRIIAVDETDDLKGRGMAILGEADAVDAFVSGKNVLQRRSLGAQKEVWLFGIQEDELESAVRQGLSTERLSLQDLFVGLTKKEEESDVIQ
jgi:ABC-2 type transport system ATP-binding protein